MCICDVRESHEKSSSTWWVELEIECCVLWEAGRVVSSSGWRALISRRKLPAGQQEAAFRIIETSKQVSLEWWEDLLDEWSAASWRRLFYADNFLALTHLNWQQRRWQWGSQSTWTTGVFLYVLCKNPSYQWGSMWGCRAAIFHSFMTFLVWNVIYIRSELQCGLNSDPVWWLKHWDGARGQGGMLAARPICM